MPRRLLQLLALTAVVALAAFVGLRWGKPRAVVRASSAVTVAPVGDGATIAWIERDAESYHLRAKRGRGSATEVLAGGVVSGLALQDRRLITSLADAPGGVAKLCSVTLRGDTKDLTTLSAPASQIVTGEGWICWATAGEPALPAAPFVAAGGPVLVVGALPEQGGAPSLVAGRAGGARAELVGISQGQLYWLERQRRRGRTFTVVMRGRLQGGETEVVAEEPGARSAVLLKGRLAWTAPSQEASSPDLFAAVKVRPLSGGEAKVVADWLSAGARLLASSDRLYAQDSECLWRIGNARGTQQIVYDRSYGSTSPTLVGADEYLVTQKGAETTLLARGVTWTAKLRHALGLGP